MCYSQHAVCFVSHKLGVKKNVCRAKQGQHSPLLTAKTFFFFFFFVVETQVFYLPGEVTFFWS